MRRPRPLRAPQSSRHSKITLEYCGEGNAHSTFPVQFAPIDNYSTSKTNSYFRSINPNNLTEQRITKIDGNGLRLRVIRQRRLAQFPSDTALLVSTEWQLVVQGVVSVDPDGTGAQGVGHSDGGVEVGRVDG